MSGGADTLGFVPESPGRPLLRTGLLVVAAVLVVVLVVAAASVVIFIRRPLPPVDGEVRFDGLEADVEILRDGLGIPQIYAEDARDLFRAQGYVHAQDRFFEMDYRRHLASGRLAELVGAVDGAVQSDSVIRTLGWRAVAQAELETLSGPGRQYLEAYAAGVNDYIRPREASRLGIEYTVLGLTMDLAEVEPWSEVDSLLWLKMLSWDLSRSFEGELERSAFYQVLDDVARVEELFPPFPEDRHAPVVGPGASGSVRSAAGVRAGPPPRMPVPPDSAALERAQESAAPSDVLDVLASGAGRSLVADVTEAIGAVPSLLGQGSGLGSNAFVVAGERTASGAPLLAADSHLDARIPGPWYQVGLHCRTVGAQCPFDVSGFGFAGMPGVLTGHNGTLAWSVTSMPADVTDLFIERVFDDGTYLRDGERPALERRTEIIRVNGGEDVELEVRTTEHGPILSDVMRALGSVRLAPVPEGAPGTGLRDHAVAVASAAMTPGRTMDGIFALDAAASAADVSAAAALFSAPTLNIVFATTDGDIGYAAAGQVPRRATVSGSPSPTDGRWPRPGWDSRYDWQGFVAPEDLPGALNPADGYIVAANQAVQPAGDGPFLGQEWDAGFRSQRIASLLADAPEGSLTVDGMEEIQRDVVNPNARLLMPYLLTLDVDDSFVQEGVDLLLTWDLQQTEDSAAAAYFASVWANVLRLTFWDDVPEGYEPDGDGRWLEVVRGLINEPQSRWWDDRTTINIVESRDEILIQALTNARLQLTVSLGKEPARWAWSKLHEAELVHPVLGQERFGAPLNAFVNPGPVPVSGGPSHVWATAWDAGDWEDDFPTFDVSTLPSMRFVVDLADLDASTWINLTGSSGHPASSHYTDQLGAWADGRTYPWFFSEQPVRDEARHTRWLRPDAG